MRRCGRLLAGLGLAGLLGAAGLGAFPQPRDCIVAEDCQIGEGRRIGEDNSICVVVNGKKVCPG